MAELREITRGLRFPEGPIAMDDGSVVVVEIESGTLARVVPDGTTTRVATVGGGPNGAAVGPDGKIYVCNNGGFEWAEVDGMLAPGPQPAGYIGGRIQRVDIGTGAVEDLYTECDGFGLRGPNDIVFDEHGGFYFTDLGKSRAREVDKAGIYYATADGTSIRNLIYGLDHTNGIGLSPDNKTLYVAETITGRLWSWEIESPGVLKPGKTPFAQGTLHYDFPGYQLLDSLAVDSEGNICVATLVTGCVSVISPSGQLVEQVFVPKHDVFVTNICFGGPDLRTAYITSSGFGILYATEWRCPGLRLNFNVLSGDSVARSKVLVAGSTGVVGWAAMRAFAADPAFEVVGLARRPRPMEGVTTIAVDLADRQQCHDVLSSMGDVTHVVYAALYEKPGLVPGWYERDQMERNLDMMRNLLDPLTSVAEDLRHISVMQGTKAYGAHVTPMQLPGREREPRHEHENFYWLQEDELRARRATSAWRFTILRPQIVFGDAFGSNMNAIPALGVYAAVLRHDGQPLHYPGGASFLTEAVDADIVAGALKWASSSPAAADETFNVTNGDVFMIENLWPAIADAFGMEVGDRVPLSLATAMPARQDTWRALVQRFDLASPVDLVEFVGQSFIYADVILGAGGEGERPATMLSTIKIRQAGFGDCIDTEDMFRNWIGRFQAQRYLPPRAW